ncbi:MAG: hypothetical protein J1F10_02200 [Muribaculaceae bacterium]|nr:hypothetical protein [Muribaculaceae bacterium]
MKSTKYILALIISVIMVFVSVLQYHHHDTCGHMCISIYSTHNHEHTHSHQHSLPLDHEQHCAAKISTMEICDKAAIKCPSITQMMLLWVFTELSSNNYLNFKLFIIDALRAFNDRIYVVPLLTGISFRAPPLIFD